MALTLSVGGDPEGGWLVDIHDGDRHEVYRPEVGTVTEAAMAALQEHDPSAAKVIRSPMSASSAGLGSGAVNASTVVTGQQIAQTSPFSPLAEQQAAMAQSQTEHQRGPQATIATAPAEHQPANDAAPEDHPAA